MRTLYSYATAERVADLVRKGNDVAVVDVRDDDFIGGQIPRAKHVPSTVIQDHLGSLVKELKDVKTVVFHCMLSQQRGPSCARRYAEARQDALAAGEVKSVLPDDEEARADGTAQEVLVLRRGFQGWVEKYARDPALVQGYDERVWGI